uniref:uncharacterized protein LOC120334492 n=1 Tax=Styela clava TaxID=7725 RepID=UPI0019397DDE|nr:uncharacterized protein LOC120334492 [Styela clava]
MASFLKPDSDQYHQPSAYYEPYSIQQGTSYEESSLELLAPRISIESTAATEATTNESDSCESTSSYLSSIDSEDLALEEVDSILKEASKPENGNQHVEFKYTTITQACIPKIAEFIKKRSELTGIVFRKCSFDSNAMKDLYDYVKVTSCKIRHFDISCNRKMRPENLQYVARILVHCKTESVNLSECDFTGEEMKLLHKNLKGGSVTSIQYNRIKNFTPEIAIVFCELLRGLQIKCAQIIECGLTPKHLLAIHQVFVKKKKSEEKERFKMEKIVLSQNNELVDIGIPTLQRLNKDPNSEFSSVSLYECGTNENLNNFANGLYKKGNNDKEEEKFEMEQIDLSQNKALGDHGITTLQRLIQYLNFSSVSLCGCGINGNLKNFANGLYKKLTMLDLSYNALSMSDLEEVKLLISQANFKRLGLAGCELNAERVQILIPEIPSNEKPELKIESLDVHDNMNLGDAGWSAVGELSKVYSLEHLNIENCDASDTSITCLTKELKTHKVC